MKQTRPYTSLQDYMERTETNGTRLLAMVLDKTGVSMSASLLSMYLRGSRRMSKFNAFAIHMVTGVSMDVLTKSEPSPEPTTVRRSAKKDRGIIGENENVV